MMTWELVAPDGTVTPRIWYRFRYSKADTPGAGGPGFGSLSFSVFTRAAVSFVATMVAVATGGRLAFGPAGGRRSGIWSHAFVTLTLSGTSRVMMASAATVLYEVVSIQPSTRTVLSTSATPAL